jgi:two-component system, NtrC family, sensor kinase
VTFRRKISVILLAVGLVPVAVIGTLAYRASRDEVTELVRRSQEQTAEDLARLTEATVGHAAEALALSARALPIDSFSKEELSEVLRIPYRQVAEVTAVALLDEKGDAVVPPVFERDAKREPPSLALMASHVPLEPALSLGTAIGPPYRAENGTARVVIAVRTGRHVVAAELSLRPIAARIEELNARGMRVVLLGPGGVPLAGAQALSPSEQSFVAARTLQSGTIERDGAEAALAAFAPVKVLEWGVLAEQPQSVALRAATRVRDYTLFWAAIGLALAAALSVWLARGVSRPIGELSVAAKALSDGRYDAVAPEVGGSDELAEFAGTFRQMAKEIRRRDEEIGGWNRELQARVDARTAELKAAQDQIQRTRRLAALGTMGAGVAHELNNPLAAVMGLAGMVKSSLAKDSPDAESLTEIVAQTKKMGAIVARLRDLTEAERDASGARFKLELPVSQALEKFGPRLAAQNIVLSTELGQGLPEVQGDAAQLQELVAQLVENAIHAMPGGGRLEIALSTVDGQALKLTVTDTGRGISPAHQERIFDPFFTTKDDPAGVGLGLSTSHQIVERHHGKLSVFSEVGKGARFTVLLPAAGEAPHLV